jgi:hypothetical protein
MLRSELPESCIFKFFDFWFILIFRMEIQFGGENDKSKSLAAIDHVLEDFEVITVII